MGAKNNGVRGEYYHECILLYRAFRIFNREKEEYKEEEILDLVGQMLKKIGENEESTKKKMINGTGLDKHKIAACICASIIEVDPIKDDVRYSSEIFAIMTSTAYIWQAMIEEAIEEKEARLMSKLSEDDKKELRSTLRKNYRLIYPSENEKKKYGDKGDYVKNMCHDIEMHKKCPKDDSICPSFDIFAYSKIFYHLEKDNTDMLKQKLEEEFNKKPHRKI